MPRRPRRASRARRRSNTPPPEVEKTEFQTVITHKNGTKITYVKGDPKPRVRKAR